MQYLIYFSQSFGNVCLFRCFSLTHFCFNECLLFLLTLAPHYCDCFMISSKNSVAFFLTSKLTLLKNSEVHGIDLLFPILLKFESLMELVNANWFNDLKF